MASIKLGDLLVKAKVLSESQLKSALTEQEKWGGKLGEILVRMNALTEDMLVKALAKQTGVQSVNLDAIQGIAPHVKAKIAGQLSRDLNVVPLQLRDEGKTLVVAMADPGNIGHLDTLRSVTRCRIQAQLAGRNAIARAHGRFYEGEADLSDSEGSLKLVNAQGSTLVKKYADVAAERADRKMRVDVEPPGGPAARASAPPPAPRASAPPRPAADPEALLRAIEDSQKKEFGALKAVVELLIQKGVFTRDEYLAKVKR